MIAKQFTKYAIVGLISNGVLYALYLLLTWVGLGPKIAMSILYVFGTVQTFVFNRKWTFSSDVKYGPSFFRYIVTYFSGYVINLVILGYFVDHLAMNHQLVQGVTILVLAAYLFVMQKYWVFKGEAD